MQLCHLLSGLIDTPIDDGCEILQITDDSRKVCDKSLFIGLAGESHSATHFLDDALRRGASAILIEGEDELKHQNGGSIYYIPHLRDIVFQLLCRFHHVDATDIKLIGITGTNGKTSIAYLLAELFDAAYIGTLGVGKVGDLSESINTTPSLFATSQHLIEFIKSGVRTCAMEVSSHAIAQKRIHGLVYETAVFTNLSHEHIDYHGDMERYGECKLSLFNTPGVKNAVMNIDDAWGRRLHHRVANMLNTLSYALDNDRADIHVIDYEQTIEGIKATIKTPWGEYSLHSPLIGHFNLSNLLAVMAVAHFNGLPIAESLKRLEGLTGVVGRMQVARFAPTFVIDYAHTPDALENVLQSLKPLAKGKLWCVFGCGGDRDKAKRPLMGEVVSRLADVIVITNDNPRNENEADIVQAIMTGIDRDDVHIEYDRAKAIQYCYLNAMADDVVLVAGKGHEDYQIINGTRYDFSDKVVIDQLTP